ncbi:Ankyrin repeat-containing domain protein [Elaphomyces granulatus]
MSAQHSPMLTIQPNYNKCMKMMELYRQGVAYGTGEWVPSEDLITPLSRAAENGDKAVVELLLKNGAQPDLEDEDGWTALLRAIERRHAVVVQLLLAQGTPLSRAAENGDEVVVELLLKNGAQPDFKDADGQTPLSRDEHVGSAAVLQLLNRSISIDRSPGD